MQKRILSSVSRTSRQSFHSPSVFSWTSFTTCLSSSFPFISLHLLESESESRSVMSNFLQPHGLYSLWNSPGQNTGVGSLSLLQGILLTQESNQGLLHCRWILH